jgi:hypothetical protein
VAGGQRGADERGRRGEVLVEVVIEQAGMVELLPVDNRWCRDGSRHAEVSGNEDATRSSAMPSP